MLQDWLSSQDLAVVAGSAYNTIPPLPPWFFVFICIICLSSAIPHLIYFIKL